ncbi:peroxiredoxin-like family protein [Mycolicibacterium sp.]|uniref:peroxiredoxin-like family protein n=1 Tax=Mycolicibacterium sp. TaxID=2320850 RepID=UPI001A344D3A|nr:peroxiredoxin-like family protein [Mycolicibacterium sp.]MBJ7341026.1 AhpC/TSA family protein [Mycolicibacterium sp.]
MSSQTSTIAEQSHALTSGPAASLPADIVAAFAAERAALDANGVPDGVAEPGAVMPDGELLDVHGAPTSLAQLRDGRAAVVVFYRGAWCPYCNIALRTYEAELVQPLAERGVVLIAVSPQKPDGSLSSAESNELTYAVASDPGNQLGAALGIVTEPSPDAVAGQLKLGLDLTEVNADGGRTLPMPTVVIVDSAGIIRWIDVHPNYAGRTEVSDILLAADSLG